MTHTGSTTAAATTLKVRSGARAGIIAILIGL